ncbi:MAG TPA: FAD-dependent oxidoreductase, partial [Thermoanaerobaculia bacterium]|nr:FAD-dependent oxidoreductase [Thermoanaerobaculia bacterium]
MSKHDVVVVGGGISGLTFAFEAARAGRSVLVLERSEKPGGCLSTHRTAGGYWFELNAHTCYNSYVGFTELIERCGLRGKVLQRAKTHLRFLDGDRLVPGSNLGVLLRLFSWPEAAISLPRLLGAKKEGKTV